MQKINEKLRKNVEKYVKINLKYEKIVGSNRKWGKFFQKAQKNVSKMTKKMFKMYKNEPKV